MYAKPPFDDPVIMGHENVGTIAVAGEKFKQLHGVAEGDRVFVEHYVGCYNCEWCRIGEYRHCEATDWRTNPDARRYGYTSSENPGTLWGGFSEYMYLPWNAVLHKVPDGVTAELAGLVTPLSNGIEWALLAGGRRLRRHRADRGARPAGPLPGRRLQAGGRVEDHRHRHDAGQGPAGPRAGPRRRRRDRHRAGQIRCERVMDLTGGRGVDFVLDCTSRAGVGPVLLGIDVLKRREGTLLIQGELAAFPDFPIKQLTEKAITIKSARGHSYRACELALAQLASGRFPLERLSTHRFGLDQVDRAIRALAGDTEDDGRHPHLADALAGEGEVSSADRRPQPAASRPGRSVDALGAVRGRHRSTRRRAAPACSRRT